MPLITLANCDTEPVHTPDAIQPFGYLLAVDPQLRAITHWSSNVAELGDLPVELSADSLKQRLIRNRLTRSCHTATQQPETQHLPPLVCNSPAANRCAFCRTGKAATSFSS
jgi:light-regulated signal transduction histidine kinase (bacteriophytochrome)